jgi:hypothetical protein
MKYAKHIHVLGLLASIPRKLSIDDAPVNRKVGTAIMTKEEALAVWDHIFTYIHANWASPAAAAATAGHGFSGDQRAEVFDCKETLRMSAAEIEARLETLPPYFTESVFPVAVARFLLRELAIPLNHRDTVTFREFHDRYGTMILAW